MSVQLTITLQFQVDVSYYAGRPGYISGPPDACYESEPPELDFYSVQHEGKEVTGDNFDEILYAATLKEIERNHMDAFDKTITP